MIFCKNYRELFAMSDILIAEVKLYVVWSLNENRLRKGLFLVFESFKIGLINMR